MIFIFTKPIIYVVVDESHAVSLLVILWDTIKIIAKKMATAKGYNNQ